MDATHWQERMIRTASRSPDRGWDKMLIKVRWTYDSMIYNITPELQQSAGILVRRKLPHIAENDISMAQAGLPNIPQVLVVECENTLWW